VTPPLVATMRLEHIAFVIALFCFSAQAESDEPFGTATVPAPLDPHATDWRKVQDDWVIEREILERCRVDRERCPSRAALQFLTIVDGARIQTGRARLGYVNRAINLAIRAMNDLRNYKVPEIWTAPLATLANGAGDCTDYAIAKYYALGEVGIPANDRRLVVVSDKSPGGQEHAVLAVREDQHWLILDNRRMAIVDAADATQYFPLLVVDHRGLRQFVNPALAPAARAVCASVN
jgi:predicted transglutaminase-like cysteine proteinase